MKLTISICSEKPARNEDVKYILDKIYSRLDGAKGGEGYAAVRGCRAHWEFEPDEVADLSWTDGK